MHAWHAWRKLTDMAKNTAQPPEDPKYNRTIRTTDEDWSRLEAACVVHRQNTGSNESVSGFARTLLLAKLQEFENDGCLTIVA